MATLIQLIPEASRVRTLASVSVFGVPWPIHKLAAVVVGFVAAGLAFWFTGSGNAAMWASAAAVVVVWWGGYRIGGSRWDDGERDFIAEHRSHC
ncbi:MAG: hypothetical protein WBA38_06490 [Gordonia sp. (in: high G+C Gram-positive bacteria)]|uniref:hypothetical protein n=1 Tax=Gordonia sp. (in: high G+C Gram-positive bacteria) TaxID=84139 RepID=UPI003C713199